MKVKLMTVLFKNVSKDFQMKVSQKMPYKEGQIHIDDNLELVLNLLPMLELQLFIRLFQHSNENIHLYIIGISYILQKYIPNSGFTYGLVWPAAQGLQD